ncbi:MAG: MgtC/SapB family protein [Acidobacteria bacterium]|nr:MgtC/SapB family protein [Acidobacteriota bacterium]
MVDFLPKALLAIVCGGLIGIEREMRSKPAGFRTNILICLGSMLFMWLSARVALSVVGDHPADPGRIAAQVVTGIGFLGAGTIIQARGRVVGLTSAAMIWVVAAVGMSIGAGYSAIAVLTTALILVVLVGLGLFERRLFGRCILYDCQIAFDDDQGRTRSAIDQALRAAGRPPDAFNLKRAADHLVLTVQYCDVHPQHKRFLSDLWKIDGVREVRPLR